MRILIHSNAPWVGSGYGVQAALLGPRLARHGYDVAYSAFSGLHGKATEWRGLKVYPGGRLDFGLDVIGQHAERHGADAVIALMDFWKMGPVAGELAKLPVLAWTPVDCHPVSQLDQQALYAAQALPVAVSRFGQSELKRVGFDARYVPHMVDTSVFRPMPEAERRSVRADYGIGPSTFVIGIAAANSDTTRKAFPEQFEAFRRFAERCPDSRLLLHTDVGSRRGLDLASMLMDFQITDKVIISDSYAQVTGELDAEWMRGWYGICDVLSLCSYGEGFGLPLVEAQACGTPVVTTAGSAMKELGAKGWRVRPEPFWNPVHRAWWDRPRISSITEAYLKAWEEWRHDETAFRDRRDESMALAQGYDADLVIKRFWIPLLRTLPKGGAQ